MKTFAMLVQRELWEHRGLWLTPLVIAAIMLLGVSFVGQLRFDIGGPPPGGPGGGADDAFSRTGQFGVLQFAIGVPFYAAAGLVIINYLLDCLYTERRDRSILFWKSLPVSDAAVVLSKFFVALVVTPLIFFAVAATVSLALDFIMSNNAGSVGNIGAALQDWTIGDWLGIQGVILYTTLATVLWYAPYAAYLLWVSAWARHSVLAWAVLPPLLLALLERLFLSTSMIGDLVTRSFTDVLNLAFRLNSQLQATITDVIRAPRGGFGRGGRGGRGAEAINPQLDISDLLNSPQLWIGLAVAALLVWAAIRVRKRSHDL